MEKLDLPEPAAALWISARDILTKLGPELRPLKVYLGGGTTLAARVGHRRSMDIDVVVIPRADLSWMTRDNSENLARKLGGTPLKANAGQIKVRRPDGIIDLNTAPVMPRTGGTTAIIAGREQAVLSTTQIMRGKLERAARPAPVRDVYDFIRLSLEPGAAGEVAAAYGMLPRHRQDRIENVLGQLDGMYETEAANELELTEKPRADWTRLGTTAARVLNSQRLTRVVMSLDPERVRIERETATGGVFANEGRCADLRDLIEATGTREKLLEAAGDETILEAILLNAREPKADGLVIDTTDWRGLDRIRAEFGKRDANPMDQTELRREPGGTP